MEKNSFKGPEVDPENIELVPGFFRGYRTWSINITGLLRPTGFAQPMVWQSGRNEAECFRDRLPPPFSDPPNEPCKQSPGVDCGVGGTHGCGFYGTYDTTNRAARKYLWHNRVEWSETSFAIGSIKATGRIILGQYGFRAQYAEIESLVLYYPSQTQYRPHVNLNYPNAVLYQNVDHLLKDFPPIPVEALVGPYPSEEYEASEFVSRWAVSKALPPINLAQVVQNYPPINLAQVVQNFTWPTYRASPMITGLINPTNVTVTPLMQVVNFPSMPPRPKRPWIKGRSKRRKKIEEE